MCNKYKMKPINVAFYSPSLDKSIRIDYIEVMVNPTPYYLHAYFKKSQPKYAPYIVWKPSLLLGKSDEELAKYIIENDIDVVCASVYIWNVQQVLHTLSTVKGLVNKPIKIVIGGPSCDGFNDEWNTKYPYIDKFVVGQGEKAWEAIALDMLGVSALSDQTTNIVHFSKDKKETKYEFEFIRGIHYSPYLECEDLVKELIQTYEGHDMLWPYETQRGCPYRCSFCDWNGGQSNKTQKRKEVDFVAEIDFLARNKMYRLHISDSNFGMWDVDVDILKRICYYKEQGHPFSFVSYGISKFVNHNFREIMRLIVQYDLTPWPKLSAQDIHPHVLKAINRPGSWEDHKEVGLELYKEFHESKGLNKIYVELIMGLPGQTYESWIATLDEIYSNGFIPRSYPFLILSNAPAKYDLDYRSLHGIKDDLVYEVIDMGTTGKNVLEVYHNTATNFLHCQIISTNTFSEYDLVKMIMADQLYRIMLSRNKWPAYGFIDVNWKHIKPMITELMSTSDYAFILEQRYANFMKYRINAMDSAQDKILVNGADMSSLIGRNYDLIHQSFAETNIDDVTAAKFLEVWDQFKPTAHWLNR